MSLEGDICKVITLGTAATTLYGCANAEQPPAIIAPAPDLEKLSAVRALPTPSGCKEATFTNITSSIKKPAQDTNYFQIGKEDPKDTKYIYIIARGHSILLSNATRGDTPSIISTYTDEGEFLVRAFNCGKISDSDLREILKKMNEQLDSQRSSIDDNPAKDNGLVEQSRNRGHVIAPRRLSYRPYNTVGVRT